MHGASEGSPRTGQRVPWANFKPEKPKPSEDRITRLAKPIDKWKLGKQLLELRKEFGHDRCLERMIKQEFAKNQAFRYPVEYDTFRKAAD